MTDRVAAFAPASIGNLGVGFDVLGLALAGVGDRVVAERADGDGVSIAEVRGLVEVVRHEQLQLEQVRDPRVLGALRPERLDGGHRLLSRS